MQTQLQVVSTQQLHAAEDNPRRDVGDVSELAASIATLGLLEPLIVCPNGDGFIVVCGHRRLAAAKAAGVDDIPVIVRDLDDRGRVEAMLIENLQRSDLAPLEEAAGYKRLLDLGVSQRELGKRIGRSQSHVSKRLSLLDVPEVGRDALDSGRITLEEALELRRLKDMPKRASMAIREGISQWRRDIKRAVDEQLRDHEYAEIRGHLIEKLKAEGCKVIDQPANSWQAKQKPLGNGYNCIDLKKGQHKKEPCHAAWIDGGHWNSKPKIVYVCTDPSRHLKTGASELKLPKGSAVSGSTISAAERKQRESAKAMKKINAAREEFATALLTQKLPRDEVLSLTVTAMLHRASADQTKIACRMLGLEADESRHGWPDYRGTLEAKAEKDVYRVLAALAFANGQENMPASNSWGWTTSSAKAYREALVKHGYELTDAERERIATREGQEEEFDRDFAEASDDDVCEHCGELDCDDSCTTAIVAEGGAS